MAFESITDDFIADLINCTKITKHPHQKIKNIDGSDRLDYYLESIDGLKFTIFVRQNTIEGMKNDFSAGIKWDAPSGDSIVLLRYNGSTHEHRNKIENECLPKTFHIHKATERYIKLGKKSEGYATITDRYTTVYGALRCLLKDCDVRGIIPPKDDYNLFNT